MRNKRSVWLIVGISIIVAALHFVVGPDYQGIWRDFIKSYLMDVLLPMNLYLLLQISLRKKIKVAHSRIVGSLIILVTAAMVETAQYHGVAIFGNTYDPVDLLMYLAGTLLGILIDFVIIDRLEMNGGGK